MILLLPILISSFLLTLPQRTTLFPYTTLFRSKKDAYRETGPPATSSSRCWRVARLRKSGGLRRRDRKSTRLNSSHVAISYAVFCLKKKKRKEMKEIINK